MASLATSALDDKMRKGNFVCLMRNRSFLNSEKNRCLLALRSPYMDYLNRYAFSSECPVLLVSHVNREAAHFTRIEVKNATYVFTELFLISTFLDENIFISVVNRSVVGRTWNE